jgi:methionyl aminopeptidase
MIPLKNERQVVHMRDACAVAATILQEVKAIVRPGISTQDLEEAARAVMDRLGAHSACYGYQLGNRRYPAHTCISVNEEVVHGIPSFRRILRDGDIVAIDIVVSHDGYIGDNAVTVPVGVIPAEWQRLLQVTEEALRLGVAKAQVGGRIGDISHAVQTYVESHGFSVVRDMVGHGVGLSMHEEPQIPNFGRKGTGDKIKPGMTLAIEPMVNLGGYKTKTLGDGWTVVTADGSPSAHFEHTVLTSDRGPEILTIPRPVSGPVHALAVPAVPSAVRIDPLSTLNSKL